MDMENNFPVRKSLRIDYYDYSTPGAYFITFCTHNKQHTLSPLQRRSMMSKLVGYIKMNASKAIRQRYGDVTVWQRGYYDHLIRNREDYEALAKYIHQNPARWEADQSYSEG